MFAFIKISKSLCQAYISNSLLISIYCFSLKKFFLVICFGKSEREGGKYFFIKEKRGDH